MRLHHFLSFISKPKNKLRLKLKVKKGMKRRKKKTKEKISRVVHLTLWPFSFYLNL